LVDGVPRCCTCETTTKIEKEEIPRDEAEKDWERPIHNNLSCKEFGICELANKIASHIRY
jgi:putative protein kinase ArgK-like GTPase of G3E family